MRAQSLWAQALTVLSGSSGLGWVGFPPSPSPVRSGFCGPVVCAMAYALTLMPHSLLLVQIQLFYYTFGSWFFLHDATSSEIEAAYAVGGLPPVRNSAAMVSKCEKTICKSLTVWPLWWLAWIAGKAGALVHCVASFGQTTILPPAVLLLCLCQGVWSPPPCCARACAFLQTWASGFHSHPVQIYFSNLLHSQVLHSWSAGLCQGVWSSPRC